MVDVSIVIVSFNVSQLLRECLDSIRASTLFSPHEENSGRYPITVETIVVDSGSSDDTVTMLAVDFSEVVVTQQGNVGFSKGNNLGIGLAHGRYILLLNPDTKVLGSAIQTLADFMESHPKVGAVGPQLLNDDGTVQSSRRRLPTMWTAFFESTWFQPLSPRRVLEQYYMLDTDDSETTRVDWVTGAALLVRREVINQVGGMDEQFFMYSEELDWQKRIGMAGWEIIYLSTAKIIHYGGKSSEQVIAQRDIQFQTSKIRYFHKHHGAAPAFILRSFLLANYLTQLLIESLKVILNHKREMRKERIRNYWQVIRSGLKES